MTILQILGLGGWAFREAAYTGRRGHGGREAGRRRPDIDDDVFFGTFTFGRKSEM